MDAAERQLTAVAALNEPARRRIYRFVATQEDAVSRDGVAAALGLPRSVAAFHLEKLAELGLLEFEYLRPSGRNGPGAGRPAKMYRRASSEIELSVPQRHYGLAAELLAQAVELATDRSLPVADALRSVAREHGRVLSSRLQPSGKISRRQVIEQLIAVLADLGYEPLVKDNGIVLRNCPFRALAEAHQELVCTMNLELIDGVLESRRLPDTEARLDPASGRCCVALFTRPPTIGRLAMDNQIGEVGDDRAVERDDGRSPASADEGGDPACWAHLVCPSCGAMIESGHLAGCELEDSE